MKRYLAAVALLLSISSVQANECGNVSVVDMSWNSASFLANLDQFILERGFGCKVNLVSGNATLSVTSMVEKQEPDIVPELWVNTVKKVADQGVEDGLIEFATDSLSDGGKEGFWVPKYLVEKYPELKTIEGVKQHAKLFKHPENENISGLYTCPSDWGCQISNKNLFKALKLADAGFEIVDPGSTAGLAGAIAKANERNEPWFGYYWEPSAIMGRYEMEMVDFGSGIDEEEFVNCTTHEECENPKVTMIPSTQVSTVVTSSFSSSHPMVMGYLSKRSFTNAEMSELLAWMDDEMADSEMATSYFLKTYPQVWKKWLPESVVDKILAEL